MIFFLGGEYLKLFLIFKIIFYKKTNFSEFLFYFLNFVTTTVGTNLLHKIL